MFRYILYMELHTPPDRPTWVEADFALCLRHAMSYNQHWVYFLFLSNSWRNLCVLAVVLSGLFSLSVEEQNCILFSNTILLSSDKKQIAFFNDNRAMLILTL